MDFLSYIGNKKLVLGMVHLLPLPGTPYYQEGNLEASREKAILDARALYEGGADGCVIQTIDKVYPNGDSVDYARLASVAIIVQDVVNSLRGDFLVGVQILFNALNASIAIARTCGGSFIRSAVYIGATHTEAGIVRANPNAFQEYRRKINAESIAVTAEIQGLHFHDIQNRSISILAGEARQAGADIVEVAEEDELENELLVQEIKEKHPGLPVFLGGYTNQQNIGQRIRNADGVFAATCFQPGGWGSRIDKDKVKEFVRNVS